MKGTRPRLNQRQRARMYMILAERDGERCRICLKPGTSKSLQVDRRDPAKGYTLDNTQLLCAPCNSSKDTRGKASFTLRRVRTGDDYDTPKVNTYEMFKNMQAEPTFRAWVWRELMKRGIVEKKHLLNAGAEHAKCSQQTAGRYLDKMCSDTGPCEYDQTESGIPIVKMRHDPATAEDTHDELIDNEEESRKLLERDEKE